VAGFARWIAKNLASGHLSAAKARELAQAGRLALAAIRTANQVNEMEQLQKLVRRSEIAAERRQQNAVQDRYAQGDEDGLVRVRVRTSKS
jgi:hypothetical protein